MKKKLFSVLGLFFALSLLSLNVTPGIASSHTMTEVSNEDITVHLSTTNFPMYSIWENGHEDTVFTVQFVEMFEMVGDERVPNTLQALDTWTWNMTDVTEDEHGSSFNLTADTSSATVLGDLNLTIINHLGEGAELSFQLVVDDYTFISTSAEAELVLGFSLTNPDHDEVKFKEDHVEFDDAYLGIDHHAHSESGDIVVSMSTLHENDTDFTYISYDKFTAGFEHHAFLGIDQGGYFPHLPVSPYAVIASFLVMIPIYQVRRK